MKTVTLDEEAYRLLATLKIDPRDSFSKVVKRHFRKSGRIRSSSGTWADATNQEITALRRQTVATFESPRKRR